MFNDNEIFNVLEKMVVLRVYINHDKDLLIIIATAGSGNPAIEDFNPQFFVYSITADCCAIGNIESMSGIDNLIGLRIQTITGDWENQHYCFIEFITHRGYCKIEFRSISDYPYSVFVDRSNIGRVSLEGLREIKEDFTGSST